MMDPSTPMPKRKREALIQGAWPRCLSDEEAACYCGIGRTLFLRLVDEGAMPAPIRGFGSRAVWDRKALDLKIDHYSGLIRASSERRLGDRSWAESP